MRFREIIDNNDPNTSLDHIYYSELINFDKIYDKLVDLTNHFDVPIEWLNKEFVDQYLEEFLNQKKHGVIFPAK